MLVAFGLLTFGLADSSKAVAGGGVSFGTPKGAVAALVGAVNTNDLEKLIALFGAEYEDDLIGGDEAAFRANLKILSRAFGEASRLQDVDDRTKALIVGTEAWPFPFPLVKAAQGWHFDTEAGIEEVITRRIGRNELNAIQLCRAYRNAQVQYAQTDRDGDGVREFAQHIASNGAKKDGLYWQAAIGEEVSPFGPLVADARDYLEDREIGDPFKDYYYKILTRRGAGSPGGRYDYIINGNMIAGFALIAFPADYGNSGIMTFICSHQGKVFQKDLGEEGDLIAGGIVIYNPDASWSGVR